MSNARKQLHIRYHMKTMRTKFVLMDLQREHYAAYYVRLQASPRSLFTMHGNRVVTESRNLIVDHCLQHGQFDTR